MRDIFIDNQDRIKKFKDVKTLNEMVKGTCKHPLYHRDYLNNVICVGDTYLDLKYPHLGKLIVTKLTPSFVYGKKNSSQGFEYATKFQNSLLLKEGDFTN